MHCYFDTVKLKTQFPKYYKECFDGWSGLNSRTPVTLNDVMNDPHVTITPEQRFFILGVVHSLPSDWKTVIRSSVCKMK